MKYQKLEQLNGNGNTGDGNYTFNIQGECFVGEIYFSYPGEDNGCAQEMVELYPVIHNGDKKWLKKSDWHSHPGYCGTCYEEKLISYKQGIEELTSYLFTVDKEED